MATEKRLIDANATFELLRSLGSRDYRRDKGTIMDAMKMISHPEYTPTVDAVEVIRCKDCKKWFRHTEVDRERGECRRYQTTKHETGYCDRGERK